MSGHCRSTLGPIHPISCGMPFTDNGGISTAFVQILDESMCVIREDICDWLQRYVFNEANVPPLENACDLLERLKSGVWLARLAHKLHFKVLAANLPRCPRGVRVTSREHKLYTSLRGTGPSNALGQLTADNLPVFSQPLKHAAESCLSESDVATGGFVHAPLVRTWAANTSAAAAATEVGVRLRNHWAARDNVSAFLEWCHGLGISQTVLFETTGLVNRTEEKNVLLTLMDLARLASRFGLAELPELVRMEREIEALEAAAAAAAASASSTAATTMTEECGKVDVSVYASRVADRKFASPLHSSASISTSSENESADCSLASVNTEPVLRYFSNQTTEVLVDVSSDVDEENSVGGGRTDSSTLVERDSLNGTSTIATNTLLTSDLSSDAACQSNANNAGRGVAAATTTVYVEVDDPSDLGDTTTISSASLPPLKASATTPHPRPRGVTKIPAPKARDGARGRVDVVKRSTSAADLRELTKAGAKRRNTRDGQDEGVTMRGLQSKSQTLSKSSIPTVKATLAGQQTRSRSQARTPLEDRTQVGRAVKSQVPNSASSLSKLSSSGFASHSSSCSDLAAEVRRQTAQCTCCHRNRLIRLDEGRYQMGSRVYYLRRFRSHVMVRVGGGWLTLNQFLDRYDPCRQKEGDLFSLTSSSSSHSHANGETGGVIHVSAANLLKSWPEAQVLKTNSR